MRILTREDVQRALPMSKAIEAVADAFVQLSAGRVKVPLRASLEVPRHHGVTLFMPGYLCDDDTMAMKIVSVFDDNPDQDLPLIHALVVVVDATTGVPEAVMDGTRLTALRTGAASGAATRALAREDTRTVAIFGAGAQGRTQLQGVCAVRPIQEAWVYDIDREQAEAFSDEMSELLGLAVAVADRPGQAIEKADVVCTATTSSQPVFSDDAVQPGTHINAVGAYTPQMQEVPPQTVLRSKVIIDHHEAALAEAGDLLIPMEQGLMTADHIHGELGEILAGDRQGRESAEEITLFKSVGVAVQDVATAAAVLASAREQGLGTEVDL